MQPIRVALFVDFDNAFLGLERHDVAVARAFAERPDGWLRWLEEEAPLPEGSVGDRRRVLVRRCYLDPRVFNHFRAPLMRAGFEVVDCPAMTRQGKNSADIRMVIDALDALASETRFDEFVLVSSDADFTPLLHRLRSRDRRTTVVLSGPASPAYCGASDVVVEAEDFATALQPWIDQGPSEIFGRMAARLREVVAARGPVHARDLPREVYNDFGPFRTSENWLGFNGSRGLTAHLVDLVDDLVVREEGIDWFVALEEVIPPDVALARAADLERVAALLAELVTTSSRPVAGALAAQHVRSHFGERVLEERWFGLGGFGQLASSLQGEGFAYVPIAGGWLTLPGAEGLVSEGVFEADVLPEDVRELALRLHDRLGVPLFAPASYQAVFEALARSVAEAPFHLATTTKRVRDLLVDDGFALSRTQISFVIKGLALRGVRFDELPAPVAFAGAFLDNVVELVARAGMTLSADDADALARWLGASGTDA